MNITTDDYNRDLQTAKIPMVTGVLVHPGTKSDAEVFSSSGEKS